MNTHKDKELKKIKMIQVPAIKFRRPGYKQSFKWENKEILIESVVSKRYLSDELSSVVLRIYFSENP